MAQPLASDFPIDPQVTSGTALADILNRFSDAVGTNNSGATPPPDTTPGMFWLDTSGGGEGVLKMRNAANTGWLQISAPGPAGVQLLADGTAAKPGLAWNSELGLGWFRKGAGIIDMVAQGAIGVQWDLSSPANTVESLNPRAAGASAIYLSNAPSGSANANVFQLAQNSNGSATLATLVGGTAVRGNLSLDAPTVAATGGVTSVLGFGFNASSSVLTKTGLKLNDYNTSGALQFMNIECYPGGVPIILSMVRDSGTGVHRASFQLNSNSYDFWHDGIAAKTAGSTAWVITSDERLKENIEPYTHGLDELIQLEPVTFNRIGQTGREIGGIAQRVSPHMPEMISEGRDGYLQLDAGPLPWALINAVKALHQRLSQLEQA